MNDSRTATALAPVAPSPAAERAARLERQVSTYLLYRSFSTDDRNRRGLEWWRDALRRHTEAAH